MKFYIISVPSKLDLNIDKLKEFSKKLVNDLSKKSQTEQITNQLISKFLPNSQTLSKSQIWHGSNIRFEEVARVIYGNASAAISGGEISYLLDSHQDNISRVMYLELFLDKLFYVSSEYNNDNFVIVTSVTNAKYIYSLINKQNIHTDSLTDLFSKTDYSLVEIERK